MLMYKTWAEKSGEMIEWMADTLGPKGMLFPFEWHCPDDPHAYYPAMCYNPCLDEYNPDGPNYTSYTHLEVMADVFTTDLRRARSASKRPHSSSSSTRPGRRDRARRPRARRASSR